MALPRRSLMDVEDYLDLDRASIEARYEYIDGHITMLAGGTANHALIGVNVTGILRRLLRGSPCLVYNSDLRVQLSETRYVYPDASVSCNEHDRGQTDMLRSPRLVVEVLSPATEAYDRGRKFSYYRSNPTIQEYVLIDSLHPIVELFRLEKNSLWTFHSFGPGEDVELTCLGVRFPVSDIYEDVIFPSEHGI